MGADSVFLRPLPQSDLGSGGHHIVASHRRMANIHGGTVKAEKERRRKEAKEEGREEEEEELGRGM